MPLPVTFDFQPDAPDAPDAPTPQAAPAAPAAQAGRAVDVAASARAGNASASDMLKATRAENKELRNQLDRLEDKRNDLSRELNGENVSAVERSGLEARIKEIDARISATDQQIAQSDLAVAKAAAVPGAVVEPPPYVRSGPPEEFFAIPIVFTIFVLAPIAIAYARRIWKRGATVIAPVPQEVRDRLDQLGDAVESIGLEVERIGEGQRFITKVMTDNGRALGAGAAQPIAVPRMQGEQVAVRQDG
jgi:BMFP domain-containing protein YqiC